jgi:hypothetical protein
MRREMETHEFWRERTGDIWAVVLKQGVVVACAGPLRPDDVDPDYLSGYDYVTRGADRIEREREEFEVLDEATVHLLAAGAD